MNARRLPMIGALILVGLLGVTLCGCDGDDLATAPPPADQGVSSTEILLGSSLALQGHASYLGTQTLRGALSYLNHVNQQGGIHGRTIRVLAYDDSYDPPRCLYNTQRLIIEDKVFALFCYVGTPTTVKILPMVAEARLPLIGMFTGANALRTPFNHYVINVRASYYEETRTVVRRLVRDLGLSRIAVFYQYDAYGFDGLTGTELALKEFDLAPVASGSYIRGTLDVEEGLGQIMRSRAEAVVMIGTYDPCARFIRLAKERGYDPLFYLVSFVGADELARRLRDDQGITVIMSQVVPPPEPGGSNRLLQGEAGYLTLLQRYFPEDKPNFVGFEGYLNARVLVEGLERAGPNLTREGFIRAIESIHDHALGADITIAFGADDHQGMDRVFFTRLDRGQFVLIESWDAIKALIRPQPAPPPAAGETGQAP